MPSSPKNSGHSLLITVIVRFFIFSLFILATPVKKAQGLPPLFQNSIETVTINGQQYFVEYVPKEAIYPAFGYNGSGRAIIREDLPPRVKKFVKAHELYHLQDKATWGGWIGREIRANLVPGFKDPIGLIAAVWKTVTDPDRIGFYLKRTNEGR